MFPMVHLALVFAFGPAIGKKMSVYSPKKVKKAAHFSGPQASSGGQVVWRGMAMSREEKRCCVYLFVCYKTISSTCCCLSEPPSPPSTGNSSAERRLSRAPCVKNYVR